MKKFFKVLLAALALSVLAACVQDDAQSAKDNQKVFRILAGSELKDVADKITAYGQTQGLSVKFDYTGSLDAVDRLSEAHAYDAVWLSHGKYLQLIPAVKSQIKQSEKTMYSRVVLGVKPEKLKELGWKSGKTTWRDIVVAAKAGKFRYGMTSPAGSNTGFVTLVSVASELSGKGDALEESDIPAEKLKELFIGQTLTSGSSGTLAELFAGAPDEADGLINYESVIRSLSQKGPSLEVLIPKEGVITADYPLMLLGNGDKAFYDSLVAYVRSDEVQKQIAQETFRTPLNGSGSDDVVNELPFPASVKVVDALLGGFMDEYSRPATSHFVLDVSGSMRRDGRIDALRTAMNNLAAGDGSVSGRFATFRQRENVTMTPFSDVVRARQNYLLTDDPAKNKVVLAAFADQANNLRADGGTAIYDALMSVYRTAHEELKKGGRTVSVVLLTDGENNDGSSLGDFLHYVNQQGSPRVPVYAILYGESSVRDMDAVVAATGGKVFDARKTSLKQVMKAIRAYQ